MKHLFLIACLCLLSFGAKAQISLSNQMYKIVAHCQNNVRTPTNIQGQVYYDPITISTSTDGKTLTYQSYIAPGSTGYYPTYTLTYIGLNNGWYIYAEDPNGNVGQYVYIKTDGSIMRLHNDNYDDSQYFEGTAVPKNNFLGPIR